MADDKPPGGGIVREIASDGSTVIRDERCKVSFRRLCAGAIEIRIEGKDCGQFGTALIDEVALALMRERSLELLVDAGEGKILSVGVTIAWARFLEMNRALLPRVTVLCGCKHTTLSMGLIRHLSNTGDLVRILSDRASYEARKAALAAPLRPA